MELRMKILKQVIAVGCKSVLTYEQKREILNLRAKGLGYYQIAKKLGLNHGSVIYYLKKQRKLESEASV